MNIADIMIATAQGRPTRVLAHSQEGWGKTWLAAHFPGTVWAAPENGFPRDLPLKPAIIPIRSWLDMYAAADMLIHQPHNFLTWVIDTVDWIEPLIHAYVLHRDSGRETELNKKGRVLESIEDYGYGKGYIAADEEWRRFLAKCDELQARRGMHVVLLCHSQVKTFKNPAGEDFDRWQPKMHERIARVCVEWAETVLFGFYDLASGKLGDEKRAKGVSDGRRLVGLRYSAMYDAKNRLGLPAVLELTDAHAFVPYLLGQHLPDAAANVQPLPPPTAPYANEQQANAVRESNAQPSREAPRDTSPKSIPWQGSPGAPAPSPAPQSAFAQSQHEERDPTDNGRPAPVQPRPTQPTPQQEHRQHVANPVDQQLLAALTQATTLARKKGDAYANAVEGWCKQANSDPKKLRAIIERVNKDCAGL